VALEQELKTIELTEKRRNEVALETERSLTEAKYELSQLRKELQFLTQNRSDLEAGISAVNEEKRMLERELLSIRSQLQLRSGT
jgi:predicted RNase H-like nuclease (RuvC/YqgF family)